MFRGLPLSLVLVDLKILLSLLIITLAIIGFLMKHHSELLQVYSNFAKMVETQFSKRIKFFWSDNALEYSQYAFQAVLHSYDTVHQLTCPSTSQQNGRVKRKLRHFLDTVRALLLSTKVPAPFWGEVALHDVHAINRIPSPVIQNQTPYERFFRSPPNYHHLHSFGFACFVLLQPHEHNKLKPRSRLFVFLAMAKLKRGIGVIILSLIVFVSLVMLSFGNIAPLSSSLTSVPPYLPHLS